MIYIIETLKGLALKQIAKNTKDKCKEVSLNRKTKLKGGEYKNRELNKLTKHKNQKRINTLNYIAHCIE